MIDPTEIQEPRIVEIETQFIGAILNNPNIINESTITEKDFYDPINKQVFKILKDMSHTTLEIALETLQSLISGATSYIHLLPEINRYSPLESYSRSWKNFQNKLKITSANRELLSLCMETIGSIKYSYDGTLVDSFKAKSSKIGQDISRTKITKDKDINEIILAEIKEAKKKKESGGKGLVGISSGIDKLDWATGGFRGGEFIVIGARPSVGKSSYAGHIVRANVPEGKKCLFITMEMTDTELHKRNWAYFNDIDLNQIRNGEMSDQLIENAKNFMDSIDLGVTFSYAGFLTIDQLISESKSQFSQGNIDYILVDYISKIGVEDYRKRPNERMAEVSGKLKQLAMELNIPVIGLAQLNRESVDEVPMMSHLAESSQVERDADAIILLHRKDFNDNYVSTLDFILAKQRNGPVLVAQDIEYDGKVQSFTVKKRIAK